MKIKSLTESPVFGFAGFQNSGTSSTMTGPVILSENPNHPLQTATKQYIDTGVTMIPAAKVASGTLAIERFPAFTGDVQKTVGSNTIQLLGNGVVAGTYTKFTVDTKGRISLGEAVIAADIPNLSWSKLLNTPTTRTGYGISDAVNKAGDTLTGFLNISNNPTANLQAAPKSYADTKLATISTYAVGDVIARPSTKAPTGFLRCNGATLSRTTYSALFAIVGAGPDVGETMPGNGQPWRLQTQFNTTQVNDITGWTAGTALPAALSNGQVFVTKNKVYYVGGTVNGTRQSTVYVAPINADGTLGTWASSTAFPVTVSGSMYFVYKNRAYIIAGLQGGGYANGIYSATIDADGTIGTWSNVGTFPASLGYGQAFVTKDRVYVLGMRSSGGATATVYSAVINADGTLGTWGTGPNLPAGTVMPQVVVTKTRVYVLGGLATSYATVYYSVINADGTLGSWSTDTSLPGTGLYGAQCIVTKSRVWLITGTPSSGSYTQVSYTAPIDTNGVIGTWTTSASTGSSVSQACLIVTKAKAYLLGGETGSSTTTAVVRGVNFTGGLNDYSAYYLGNITSVSANEFRLPDFSDRETGRLYYFVKH